MNYQQPNKKNERARTWSHLVKKVLALVLVCLPLGLLAIYQGGKRLSGRSKARILNMVTTSAANTPAADNSVESTPLVTHPGEPQPLESTETPGSFASSRNLESLASPSVEPQPTEKIPVHVTGAVKQPGLYFLPAGALVSDAIDQAGPGPDADLEAINLALPLIANSQVRIPSRKEQSDAEEGGQGSSPSSPTPYAAPLPGPGTDPPGNQAGGLGAKVNLNMASLEDLQKIPGVGPSTAQKILAYRQENGPFQQVEDLMQVKGIKEGKFAKMVDYIYVP